MKRKKTPGKMYQRLYASSTSEWRVPRISSEVMTLIDDTGTEHIANINYSDKSYEVGNIPILIKKDNSYIKAYLYVSKEKDVWQIDGLSFDNDTVAERSYFSMKDPFFEDALFATSCIATDNVFFYTTQVPISDFTPVDINKENWRISFGTIFLTRSILQLITKPIISFTMSTTKRWM